MLHKYLIVIFLCPPTELCPNQKMGLRRLTDEIFKNYSIHPDTVIETKNIESAFRSK
ncbi:hypothetical protein [Oceanobacillus kapialis]|uniref:hypothetical protein n=1 Tax=Oceanobacillus kapialis TaxID=481353 RepID=UPI00384A5F55